jgi:hypothetical protein
MIINKSKVGIIFLWIILFLFSAFRYEIGSDYNHYVDIFNSLANGKEYYRYFKEFGFVYLNDFVYAIGGTPQLFFFITSLFTITLLYFGFKFYANSKSQMLFITMLFIPLLYFYSLNAVRQILSVAIFLYASRYIISREKLKYFLLSFIAISFHYTAVIILPLYWILNKNIKSYFIYMLLVFIIFGGVPHLIEFLLSTAHTSYSNYFTHEKYSATRESKYLLLIYYSVFIIGMTYLKKYFTENRIIFNAIIIYFLIKIIALDMIILNRLSVYFKPFFIIGLIYIMYIVVKRIKGIKNLVVICFLIGSLSISIVIPVYLSVHDEMYREINFNLSLFDKYEKG